MRGERADGCKSLSKITYHVSLKSAAGHLQADSRRARASGQECCLTCQAFPRNLYRHWTWRPARPTVGRSPSADLIRYRRVI